MLTQYCLQFYYTFFTKFFLRKNRFQENPLFIIDIKILGCHATLLIEDFKLRSLLWINKWIICNIFH